MKSQPKNEKYANGSVGVSVRLMVRGGCLPVRGSKGMEWKYDDDLCVCGTKKTEIHVLFECKCYAMVRRRWLRTWDVPEEKERTMCKTVNTEGPRGFPKLIQANVRKGKQGHN